MIKGTNLFFNVDQIASIISCGAVIENMKIAASSLNIMPKVELLPYVDNSNLMGVLDFKNAVKCEKDPLSEFIWIRHTNRKFYKRIQIEDSVLNSIREQGEKIDGAKVKLICDRSKIKNIAKIVYNVDKIRVEFRPLHEHLMEMIRFNQREMYSTRDGLPLKNLEAGVAGEIFLRITKPWAVMELFNKLGIGKLVAYHSYRALISSSAVGLIIVSGNSRKSFLKGGMSMQRVWLESCKNGLHFQPMTAITLFFGKDGKEKRIVFLIDIERC